MRGHVQRPGGRHRPHVLFQVHAAGTCSGPGAWHVFRVRGGTCRGLVRGMAARWRWRCSGAMRVRAAAQRAMSAAFLIHAALFRCHASTCRGLAPCHWCCCGVGRRTAGGVLEAIMVAVLEAIMAFPKCGILPARNLGTVLRRMVCSSGGCVLPVESTVLDPSLCCAGGCVCLGQVFQKSKTVQPQKSRQMKS